MKNAFSSAIKYKEAAGLTDREMLDIVLEFIESQADQEAFDEHLAWRCSAREKCQECGATIDESQSISVVSFDHEPSCSLHPSNVAGG